MSKTKKIISLVLVAMLVMAMATVAIVSTSAMSADEIHVVAGAAELCGSAWDPADTNNQMTYNAEKDIYEKVFTGVAAGTYEFKVTTNYGWDNGDWNLTGDAMYGGPNASVTVDVDGSTVIVGFNGAHATVEVVAGEGGDTPVDPTPTDAPVDTPTDAPVVDGDTITVYFTNNWAFVTQNVHYWGSASGETTWPGLAMTFVETNENGENIFSAEIPADVTGIIFNGEHDQQPGVIRQTVDITEGIADNTGFYCVEEVEGKITVGTYEYIVTEDPTDAPVVTDAPTDAPVVTDAPTAAPTDAPVVGGTGITVDGVVYDVKVGDTVTYTVDLTAARLFENIQAIVNYDADKLDLQLITSDDPDVADWEVQGPEYCKNLDGVIFNAGIAGTVKFNSSKVAGYNFKTEANLITLTFVVKDASASEIDLTIEEMTIKGGEESYFANGEAVTTEGITIVEKLDVPVVENPTQAPTQEPTEAPTDAPVVGGTGITVDGVVYDVKVGDTVTYTVDLTAARLFENIQAIVTFDPEKLDLQLITSDDPDVADWEVQGPEYCKNLDGVIFNAGIPGTVKFNASKVAGYNFKTEANLITLTFVVKDASASEIALTIEEMTIKGGEESYFANGEAVITDGITVVEKLDVPVVEDPTEAPTQEPTAAPTDAPVVPTAAPTDAPVVPTAAPTDAPVVPTAAPTDAPVEPTKAPTDAPVEPTKAPTAVVDPTSGSDVPASSTTGGTGAPNTGAAAYIYVVVAVLAMAACAVVVLRKRVNG